MQQVPSDRIRLVQLRRVDRCWRRSLEHHVRWPVVEVLPVVLLRRNVCVFIRKRFQWLDAVHRGPWQPLQDRGPSCNAVDCVAWYVCFPSH
jgi:hypothetical protein